MVEEEGSESSKKEIRKRSNKKDEESMKKKDIGKTTGNLKRNYKSMLGDENEGKLLA